MTKSSGKYDKIIVADGYEFNLTRKTITDPTAYDFAFAKSFGEIEKIKVERKNIWGGKTILIWTRLKDDVSRVELDEQNHIITIVNHFASRLEDNFLYFNDKAKNIVMPSVKKIGKNCFYENKDAVFVHFGKLESVGTGVFERNAHAKMYMIDNMFGPHYQQQNISNLNEKQ